MAAPTFNPFTQNITILASDPVEGLIPFNTTITSIDDYIAYGIRISINYATQIGASLILLIVLLLLTRPDKRHSAIFALNATALALNTIRNILQCLYFTGPFYEFYAYFAGDYSRVPNEQIRISVTGDVLALLLLACLETSLILQVRAVCVTMRDRYKLLILLLSIGVALAAVGVRFALTATNARSIVAIAAYNSYQWLAATSNYVTAASICFFSAIFVVKLGAALLERRKMGMRQFGPMQVIFIMGGQTLVVPALFSVLQNFTPVPELGSQVLTVVALFLPLSSMWASASLVKPPKQANNPNMQGLNIGNIGGNGSNGGTFSHVVRSVAEFLTPKPRPASSGSSRKNLLSALSSPGGCTHKSRPSTSTAEGTVVGDKSPAEKYFEMDATKRSGEQGVCGSGEGRVELGEGTVGGRKGGKDEEEGLDDASKLHVGNAV